MIVKCEKLFNENTKEFHPGPSNRGLTIGNLYAVLEIYFDNNQITYRIFDDGPYSSQHPFLIRSDEFSIVSGNIPDNWQLVNTNGYKSLSPRIWNIFDPWYESFWQDWDNNLPKARKCFDDELRTIFECDADLIKVIDEQQGKRPYFSD